MSLSKFESALLVGIICYFEQLLSEPIKSTPWSPKRARQRQAAQEACIVDVDLQTFLGHPPSRTERNLASASYKRLEELGLLVRLEHQWSNRVAKLQIEPVAHDTVKHLRDSSPAADHCAETAQEQPMGPVEPGHPGDAPEVANNG